LDQKENNNPAEEIKLVQAPAEPPAPPELSALDWVKSNAVFLIMLVFGIGWLYTNFGFDGVIKAGLVALGLGFVIFIHELGHFAAAKWCDVHVKTFSIGFGPALPGCSFRRGETQYMIGVLPLGGYVAMVGEGSEAEEGEDYPRSYKNKRVGQRMLIISAGVIMNIILGAICFIVVYRFHGVPRPPAVVWRIDAGSPAWQAGVRSGSTIVDINGTINPTFDDLRLAVALSGHGTKIPFELATRGDTKTQRVLLEPRRDKNDIVPMIGVAPPPRAVLAPLPNPDTGEVKQNLRWISPFVKNSAAAKARAFPVTPGEVVTGITDKDGQVTQIPCDAKKGWFDSAALAAVLATMAGKECKATVTDGDGKTREIAVGTSGFMPGDAIVGITKIQPAEQYNPFRTENLPEVKTFEKRNEGDYFAFAARMGQLAGKPVALVVKRFGKDGKTETLFVPPAYHYRLGLQMKMGEVAVLREGSSAEKAGIRVGDRLSSIELVEDGKSLAKLGLDAYDPIRLPEELTRLARNSKKCQAILTVGRRNDATHQALAMITLPAIEWDHTYDDNLEEPVKPASPLSIPQLGIAYRVENTVLGVEENSPAAKAGIKPFDVIEQVRFARIDRKTGNETWDKWTELKSWREANLQKFDQWAFAFAMLQERDLPKLQVKFRRTEDGKAVLKESEVISAEEDPTWPTPEIGLHLVSDFVMQKADSAWDAVMFGTNDTAKSIRSMYQNLASLMSGRISTNSLGGPIEIASQTFSAAEDPFALILFLGMISINLAVVNFLPIPMLDGGHMVFLIYEKIRGKPASDLIMTAATYLGLAIVLSLMAFVFYLDIKRRFF